MHSQHTGRRRRIMGRCEAAAGAGGGGRRRWRRRHFFPSKPFPSHPRANNKAFFGALSITGLLPLTPSTGRGDSDRRKTTRIDRIPPTPPDISGKVNRVERKGTGRDERGRHRHWRLGACRCLSPVHQRIGFWTSRTAAGYGRDHKRPCPFLKSCDFCLTGRRSPP